MKEKGIEGDDMISLFLLHVLKGEESVVEKYSYTEKINSLILGKGRIDKEIASVLSSILGQTQDYWLQLQSKYDISLIRLEQERRKQRKEQYEKDRGNA